MNKRKICVVVTARPSYSRIKTALDAIQSHPALELQVVVAASALLPRFGHAEAVMERDGFTIAARIYNILEGDSPLLMAKTTGLGIIETASVFGNLAPDLVVTIADRYETLATAVAAAYMNIPLVHIQGGEMTGSIDDKVRNAITKLADYHFVATQTAGERVRRLGANPETVHVTGCPSIDLAASILTHPELDFDPYQRYGGVGAFMDLSDGYIVVMQHPVTTEYQLAHTQINETLAAIDELQLPTLWFWPNVDAGSDATSNGIRAFRERRQPTNLHFFKNMSPEDFLRLVYNARCLVGNSSVAIRECSYLGVPAVNIGTRQQGRERGRNVLDVDFDRRQIVDAIRQHLRAPMRPVDQLYGDGKAGARVAHCLAGLSLARVQRCAA